MQPELTRSTRTVYPQLDGLPPNRRTALISRLFNRLAATTGEGDRRREIMRIAELLTVGDPEPEASGSSR